MILVIRGSEIINIGDGFPINNPTPGLNEDGNYVLYLDDLEGLKPFQFMRQRYWDGTQLLPRDPPPSAFCTWNNGWVVDEVNLLREIRRKRNNALYECDWTQLADSPLSSEQKAEAVVYRQALRDITNSLPSPCYDVEDVIFPTKPSFL